VRALAVAALAAVSLPASPAAAAPSAAAACTPAQVVTNGGFESGTSPWTQSSTSVITSRSGQTAHGATGYAWLC